MHPCTRVIIIVPFDPNPIDFEHHHLRFFDHTRSNLLGLPNFVVLHSVCRSLCDSRHLIHLANPCIYAGPYVTSEPLNLNWQPWWLLLLDQCGMVIHDGYYICCDVTYTNKWLVPRPSPDHWPMQSPTCHAGWTICPCPLSGPLRLPSSAQETLDAHLRLAKHDGGFDEDLKYNNDSIKT